MGAVAGLDWAAEKHDVLIAGEHGEVLAKRVIDHTEQGVCELIDLLLEQRVERVAIERPEGLLVGRLLADGIEVLAIHPIRSTPPGSAFARRAASPTPSTRSCSASSPAPITTASPGWRPPVTRRWR